MVIEKFVQGVANPYRIICDLRNFSKIGTALNVHFDRSYPSLASRIVHAIWQNDPS